MILDSDYNVEKGFFQINWKIELQPVKVMCSLWKWKKKLNKTLIYTSIVNNFKWADMKLFVSGEAYNALLAATINAKTNNDL